MEALIGVQPCQVYKRADPVRNGTNEHPIGKISRVREVIYMA